jgi:hypothetical protein
VKWLPFVACYFIPRGRGFFLSSLSLFLPLVLPSLGVFSPAGSFRCPFLVFGLSARFMLLGSLFTWVYFMLESFSPRGRRATEKNIINFSFLVVWCGKCREKRVVAGGSLLYY